MTKSEWRGMVRYIYQRAVSRREIRLRRIHPLDWPDRFAYATNDIARVLQALRFIEDYFDDEDELTAAFTLDFLVGVLRSLEDALALNERLVVDSHFSDVIQGYYFEIVDGMDITDLPAIDLEGLNLSGSPNPQEDMRLLIERVKRDKEIILKQHGEGGFSYALRAARERVTSRRKTLENKEANVAKPIKKRWFKGCGQIGQGVLLNVIDGTLIFGMWPFPMSPETETVGAVVSITNGISSILMGIGEFLNE